MLLNEHDQDLASSEFQKIFGQICTQHLPSKHAFFENLKKAPSHRIRDPNIMDKLYECYQSCMHASRAMGYFLPHLDGVSLRVQKLRILAEDDGIPGGDTHHFQLRRTWTSLMERPPLMNDTEFGDLDSLAAKVDKAASKFILEVKRIYPLSLGPWVVVEGLAHDWIGALMIGLSSHFPNVQDTDYFRENYLNCLEVEHARISLDMTCTVLSTSPKLLETTVNGARTMAHALDDLWSGMDTIIG